MGGVECRHGANKSQSNADMGYQHFAAKYINREAASVCKHDRVASGIEEPMGDPPLPVGDDTVAQGPAKELRPGSALQLFHRSCTRRDQNVGLKFNPCSSTFWKKVTEEFAVLPVEDRQYWDESAENLLAVWRRVRAMNRQAARAIADDSYREAALANAEDDSQSAAVGASDAIVPHTRRAELGDRASPHPSGLALVSGPSNIDGEQSASSVPSSFVGPSDIAMTVRAAGGVRKCGSQFEKP